MKGIVSRMATGVAVGVLMAVVALPASAQQVQKLAVAPVIDVAFPTAGVFLRRGQNWMNGVACDPNAAATDATAGISKITVFLGDRDTGDGVPSWRPGGFMGQATLGGTTPEFSVNASETSRLGLATPDMRVCTSPTAGFRILPSSFRKGIWTMNVYVFGKNGKETRVTIPGLRVDKP
jgi:hypothetical protein